MNFPNKKLKMNSKIDAYPNKIKDSAKINEVTFEKKEDKKVKGTIQITNPERICRKDLSSSIA